MTVSTDLSAIQTKVRRLTGRLSPNQLSDADLNQYINNFYLYNLPEHLRLFNLKQNYSFDLEPDVLEYTFDFNQFISVEPPCYVGGYEIDYYQDQQSFFNNFTKRKFEAILAAGSGIAGPYAGTLTGTPILRNSVFISAVDAGGNSLVAEDDGAGSFTGDVLAGATIDYDTGAIANLTFTAVIPGGENINAQYFPFQAARPLAVLFFNDTFTFWPVPDKAYQFEIEAFVRPTELVGAATNPQLNEWWELLAYGAALKILGDTLDMDGYGKVKILFDEQMSLVERRTLKQLSNQRVQTIYDGYDKSTYGGSYSYI